MCGIVGFNFKDSEKLAKMCHLIDHRGPDDDGVYESESLSLGQKRLSVLDLSLAGHQPMFYCRENGAFSAKHNSILMEKSRVDPVIVYNGEIYNFHEIRSELERAGYTFNTKCDTELILAAYVEWGVKCVEKFNGMWAFCIYDRTKNELFLSRDRTGKKPLYYYSSGGKFIFGSELKTILIHFDNKQINRDAFSFYMGFGYTPPGLAMVDGVRKLDPGTNMVYDLAKSEIKSVERYWKTSFSDEHTDLADIKGNVYRLIDNAVKRRLISDVPVGAFLSGGIDSSIIVYFMRKYIADLKTFSVGFEYEEFNESSWAKIIADKFKTDHYEITFTGKDALGYIPELVNYFDEPFGDASMIPTYLMSKVAKDRVTVCLSGTGGDELFGGYERYQQALMLSKVLMIPGFMRRIFDAVCGVTGNRKIRELGAFVNSGSLAECYMKVFSPLFWDKGIFDKAGVMTDNIAGLFNNRNKISNMLSFDQNVYLPDDLLVKEDRASMAVSLEGRIPFLDVELVEYANNISHKLKIKDGEKKYILKETFAPYLPHEVLYRRKQGFGVPLNRYFKNELKDFAYDSIFNFDGIDYYDKKELRANWESFLRGDKDYSAYFWQIISFNQWYKKWM